VIAALPFFLTAFAGARAHVAAIRVPEFSACRAGPEYYAIALVPTNRVPGTGVADAWVDVEVANASPFSVSLTPDGSYQYDLRISIDRMRTPRGGTLVAWVTTPDLDRVERLGPLDAAMRAAGAVTWNKFIVVITLEPTDQNAHDRWTGPIVFRGMSRSGKMHTMAGHGAFEQENCAAFGY